MSARRLCLLLMVLVTAGAPDLHAARKAGRRRPPAARKARPSTSATPAKPAAPAAPAIPHKQLQAARSHFETGKRLYSQGSYAAAWLEFSSAYQIVPRPALLFNMARCEARMNRNADALAHFRAYLEAVPEDPDAAGIRVEIARLEQAVRLAEQVAAPPPPPQQARGRRPFPLASVLLGAGTLALGVAGAAVAGVVEAEYGGLERSCSPNCSPDDVRDVRGRAGAAYVLLGLAAAGAVTTAILLPLQLRTREWRRLGVTPGPTGVTLVY